MSFLFHEIVWFTSKIMEIQGKKIWRKVRKRAAGTSKLHVVWLVGWLIRLWSLNSTIRIPFGIGDGSELKRWIEGGKPSRSKEDGDKSDRVGEEEAYGQEVKGLVTYCNQVCGDQ